jgi:hypothetical protein
VGISRYCISLDTKHIIAWVKENNPKAYVEDRYDKTKQPPGDPDCRLGCKRRHNRKVKQPLGQERPPTPVRNPVPVSKAKIGEFYWGYGSGVIVVKVPGWASSSGEMTQPLTRRCHLFFPAHGPG